MRNTANYLFFLLILSILIFFNCSKKEKAYVYGVNFNGRVMKYDGKNKWIRNSDNVLFKLSVDNDGVIWGITQFGKIVSFDDKGNWQQIPSKQRFRDISVGSSKTWILGNAGSVYFYDKENNEIKLEDDIKLKKLDVCPSGCIWGIDEESKVHKKDFDVDSLKYSDWLEVSINYENLIDICSAGPKKAWVVSEDGSVFRYGFDQEKNIYGWNKISKIKLRAIDVDNLGRTWGIDEEGYAVILEKGQWKKFDIQLSDIATGGEIGIN